MNPDAINALATQCRQEQIDRSRGSSSCFQLFRLALIEENEYAWQAVCTQFNEMVLSWIYQYNRFLDTDEEAEYFVNEAFARFWQFGRAHAQKEKFAQLGDCLQYLRRCVWSAIEDYIRQLHRDALWEQAEVDPDLAAEAKPVDRKMILEELFEAIWEITAGDSTERIIAEESWIYGLQPRHIQEKYPQLFSDVSEVHQGKKNLLRRLKRHPKIIKLGKLMG